MPEAFQVVGCGMEKYACRFAGCVGGSARSEECGPTGLPRPTVWNGILRTVEYWYYDGTSQATPQVAGLVNYLIAKEGLVGPTALRNRLIALATNNKIVGPNGSPNRLAYNGDGY